MHTISISFWIAFTDPELRTLDILNTETKCFRPPNAVVSGSKKFPVAKILDSTALHSVTAIDR